MALGDLVGISTNQGVRAYDNGDGTFTLQVQTTASTPTTSIVTNYTVTTAFVVPAPGAALGDTVQSIATYNSVTGVLLSEIWTNATQGTVLAAAPNPADLALQATNDPYGTQFFLYRATASSGGATIGDIVQRAVSTNLVNGSTINTWYDVTTGVFLTGGTIPAIGSLTPVVPTPSYTSDANSYIVTTAFAGAAVNDVLARFNNYDPSIVPPTLVSSTWFNLTQGTTLGATPSYANISPSNGQVTPVLPQKTADMIYATGVGTTPAGAIQCSFANVGIADAIVGPSGSAIPPGATLDFTASSGGSIAAIPYDATGTTLLVATLA